MKQKAGLKAAMKGVAGVDEAGRGPLAGPVVAAAVLLPHRYRHPAINDSKKLNEAQRETAAEAIRADCIGWAIGEASVEEILERNILGATMLAMRRAINALSPQPARLLIDGHYFRSHLTFPHRCCIGGDATHTAIAAASILAKVHRDGLMCALGDGFPQFGWAENKGYGTPQHRAAIAQFGPTPHHRLSFLGLTE